MSLWVEATRHLHLTLGDVRAWDVGSVHRFACLDRNIDDLACRQLTSSPKRASRFLKHGYSVELMVVAGPPTKGSPPRIAGRVLCGGDDGTSPSESDEPAERWRDWEFDVEYAPGRWHPLDRGVLTGLDLWKHGRIENSPIPLKRWTANFAIPRPYRGMDEGIPSQTRLGWEGAHGR